MGNIRAHCVRNNITLLCDFVGVCDTCVTWMMQEPCKMHDWHVCS